MKKICAFTFILFLSAGMAFASGPKPKPCGKYQGHNIYKGEKGGCYYLKTKKKVKVYIDKKHCNC